MRFLVQNGQESAEKCSELFRLSPLPLYPSPKNKQKTPQKTKEIRSKKNTKETTTGESLTPLVAERAFPTSDYWGRAGVARCAEEMTGIFRVVQ